MKKLILLLALACAWTAASADAVYEGPGLTVRLTDGNCPLEILKQLPEGTRGFFRLAAVTANGKATDACWAVDKDGDVFILDAAGDNGYIPGSEFKRVD